MMEYFRDMWDLFHTSVWGRALRKHFKKIIGIRSFVDHREIRFLYDQWSQFVTAKT